MSRSVTGSLTRSPATSPLPNYPRREYSNALRAERLVERLVHELIGALVRLAADVAHGPAVELAQLPHRLDEQRLQAGVLDLVHAVDLAGHELGVVHHLDLPRAQLAGEPEPQQHRPVLRHVVRGLADVLALFGERGSIGRADHGAD